MSVVKNKRKERVERFIIYLLIILGIILFSIPFVWMVSTSVKEDKQIFKYPPEWIPKTHELSLRGNINIEDRFFTDWKNAVKRKSMELKDRKLRIKSRRPWIEYASIVLDVNGKEENIEIKRWMIMKYSKKYIMSEAGEVYPVGTIDKLLKLKNVKVKKISGIITAGDSSYNFSADNINLGFKYKVRFFFENYIDVFFEQPYFFKFIINTLIVTFITIFFGVFVSSLVAYSFSRLNWPGRDILFLVLLGTMMIPGQVTMIPVFLIFRWLGMVNTLTPLWIGSLFGNAFFIFMLRQFFLTLPKDLEDAAKIDGCSYFQIFYKVLLPLLKPALATVAIWQFMGSWNDFMGPLIYINAKEKMTLALGLQIFQSTHGGDFALLMAASLMMVLPVILIFFFFQRYFIQGVTLSGLKI